jgi:hypothetical protein
VERSQTCAECGGPVLVTNGTPVVRAGLVLLLCAACNGGAPVELFEDDADSGAYSAIELTSEDEQESRDYRQVSGSIDVPAPKPRSGSGQT